MALELSKDVEIDGHRYQVTRFKARVGSFILTTVLTKLLPSALQSDFSSLLPQLSEEDFALVQGHALESIRRYNAQGIAEPIFLRPDRWAIKELEYDLGAVMRLTVEALVFNLSDFFSDGGLVEKLLSSLPGLAPTS